METNTRRTQAERTAETRGRLIDATIRLIRDEGITGATTRRLCDEVDLDAPANFEDRIKFLLDLVWDDMDDRGFGVWLKSWVAAMDDPDLQAGLRPMERRLRRRLMDVGRRVLTEGVRPNELAAEARRRGLEPDDLDALVGLAISTMTGIVFVTTFTPGSARAAREAASRQRRILERLLLH